MLLPYHDLEGIGRKGGEGAYSGCPSICHSNKLMIIIAVAASSFIQLW